MIAPAIVLVSHHFVWSSAMPRVMPDFPLRFTLGSGQSLPCHLGWRIEDGYLRMTSWSDQAETITLGIWGPGELVIPSLIELEPVELVTLSAVQVVEAKATLQEERQFLIDQVGQASALLVLSRVRPVETRLFRLLVWLGQRFGRISRRGVSLSFQEMNLTHRQLAEIAGMTRVTVTKALSHYRQVGMMVREGNDELLVGQGCR
jgi:CRP-like cAMP-binding protein